MQKLSFPSTGFLRERQVLQFIPVSRSTLWTRVRSGEWPAPVKLSEKISAWRAEDIKKLIEQLGQVAS